jgi:hypothetical protein
MESCRPAIIVSFGALGPQNGVSAAGIDSVAEFREVMSALRIETPRSVPVKGGRAMTIFSFLTASQRRSVSILSSCFSWRAWRLGEPIELGLPRYNRTANVPTTPGTAPGL